MSPLVVGLKVEATKWKTISVDEGIMACQSLQIADLDNDARLDLVAAGWTTKKSRDLLESNKTRPGRS